MQTEYEARAKNLEEGPDKEAILDELDLRMRNGAMELLIGQGDPSNWIIHNRDPKNLLLEHVKIGMVIPFEIAESISLPDGIKDCDGIESGCIACTAAAKTSG